MRADFAICQPPILTSKPQSKLFISIDEIQKLPLDDVALICNAFQMASRKGYDVMLAIAGLPYAHDRIIHHDGCTFMRRAVHKELGPLSPVDVEQAFGAVFGNLPGFSVSSEALSEFIQKSKGHPYMMQLEGFYAVEHANEAGASIITPDDATRIISQARATYLNRAIAPLVEELPEGDRAYLTSMARRLNDQRVAQTKDIAQDLEKSPNQTSQIRRRLLDAGIVVSPAHGCLSFFIPYLAEYLLENQTSQPDAIQAIGVWQI